MIYVKNPIIVPGGRFREFYYWDTYWMMKGLRLSKMYTTVRGMLENFLEMVKIYGFVPNGGRRYYEGRSQPPLLTPMVAEYVDATGDIEFLDEALPLLETEFKYWKTNHGVTVKGYRVYRYFERSCGPRPESYYEDINTASGCATDVDRENMYSEIKAAANSGMDFSSRWYIADDGTNQGVLKDLKTRYIAAVDVNAWLYYGTKCLKDLFLKKLNVTLLDRIKSGMYEMEASKIKKAMDQVFWNEEVGCWLDYDLINQKPRNYFVASNFLPLYVECYDSYKRPQIAKKILNYISMNNLDSFVSVPNTLFAAENGQQWDYPNVWPPMQVEKYIFTFFTLRTLQSKSFCVFSFSTSLLWDLKS